MLNTHTIAHTVSQTLNTTADRYTQIFAIKKALINEGLDIFATDRETIDGILDILYSEYKFQA